MNLLIVKILATFFLVSMGLGFLTCDRPKVVRVFFVTMTASGVAMIVAQVWVIGS